MLAFTLTRGKQSRAARPESAERRLGFVLDQRRPKVQKSAFGFIFADTATKAEITGIEVPHSRSEFPQHLNRYGALGYTEPSLRKWLKDWVRRGGIAAV
jgi:hypothetical protein